MHKIAIVSSQFHEKISNQMVDYVTDYAANNNLTIIKKNLVPGAMEYPLTLKKQLLSDEVEGSVVLGLIEKGETKHGFVMAQAVISSIINIQLETMKPVGVGIMGPEISPNQIDGRVEHYSLGAIKALESQLKSS